jgi:hypothetical protein
MRHWKMLSKFFLAAGLLCMGSAIAHAQGEYKVAAVSTSPTETAADVRALAELIRDLQSQVQALNAQLGDLRAEQQRASEESRELRRELDLAKGQMAAASGRSSAQSPTQYPTPIGILSAPQSSSPAPQEATVAERLATLEENQEISDSRLNEQSQTKIESGSKYRVRFSGIVLLNLYENRGLVDNQDFPETAEPPASDPLRASPGSFGGSLRQSQIKIEAFGPDLFGARTSANLAFDFGGGFANTWNGAAMGVVRLRTGTMRLDWADTSIVAGQDSLFFSPLAPTSLATLAIPALSYSGNLWVWTPQVRVEHRLSLSENSNIELQAGILDSVTGDVPGTSTDRDPSWGEESGQPAYATRISWNRRLFGQNLSLGWGGFYGHQDWGYNRLVDGWASMVDATVPLGKLFEFTGAFYRGRALGGLGGGIGQTVLLNGSFGAPTTTFRGLDSMGGWAQLKFNPTAKLEINAALGLDNPFASELRQFQSHSVYGVPYTRNLSPLANFIYRVRSDILFSLEYRRLQTTLLDAGSNSANHFNMSIGYIF